MFVENEERNQVFTVPSDNSDSLPSYERSVPTENIGRSLIDAIVIILLSKLNPSPSEMKSKITLKRKSIVFSTPTKPKRKISTVTPFKMTTMKKDLALTSESDQDSSTSVGDQDSPVEPI